METISDPVISRFITKIQVHMNQTAKVVVGDQASISLLNSNIGDVPEDHTIIWCAMVDIMKIVTGSSGYSRVCKGKIHWTP